MNNDDKGTGEQFQLRLRYLHILRRNVRLGPVQDVSDISRIREMYEKPDKPHGRNETHFCLLFARQINMT